jgi:chemotaxis protein CheD
MGERVNVRISEIKVTQSPKILRCLGLGSCVAIALYDSVIKIGGLAHVMLPDINKARTKDNKAKFANTAIELLLKKMLNLGAVKSRMKAKIVGGANMFPSVKSPNYLNIGEKNLIAVKKELRKKKIRLVAEDTGGDYGRSMEFFTQTGEVRVRTILYGEKEL